MATGPEHYAQAELALANAARVADSSKSKLENAFLRYAEVHALLAMAPDPTTVQTSLGQLYLAGKPVTPQQIQEFISEVTLFGFSLIKTLEEGRNYEQQLVDFKHAMTRWY
jgi:hypothetical protein